ncbi:hypothetical protein [Paenirhodobacter sp.]|uniref:hypothetical protein n=1 Tax=Paenirhodobacter sp. TaxID=1965326 RepID=UPI003B514290
MTGWTVFDTQGRITARFEGSEQDLALNLAAGTGYIAGHHDPAQVYIVAGQPVPFPAAPGDWAVWDWATHAWSDPRDAAWHAARLAEARAAALAQITALRGAARLAYITDIPGQEAIYIAKLEEARAWLAAVDPDIADYPLIGSEVGVTAPTPYEVAQVFLNLNALWVQVAAAIDGGCFAAEAAVQAATAPEDVAAIIAALSAQLGGIAP